MTNRDEDKRDARDAQARDYKIRVGVQRAFHIGVHQPESAPRDVDDELAHFIRERTESLVARGLSPDNARAEAIRRLGNDVHTTRQRLVNGAQQRERKMRLRDYLSDIEQDIRYAARGLKRRPGFTAIAIATLALGIGANTAIFSAVNTLLLQPLPFREPQRLMQISLTPPLESTPNGLEPTPWSFRKFVTFRDAQRVFSTVALQGTSRFNLNTDQLAERVEGELVTAAYLSTLGITPAVGRDFSPKLDSLTSAPHTTIISDQLWQRLFNRSASAIGQNIRIDGEAFEVIGVLKPNARGVSGHAELLIPITTRSADNLQQAWSLEFTMIGRLKPQFTLAQGSAEATRLGKAVYDASPWDGNAVGNAARSGWGAMATPLDDARVSSQLRRSVLLLFGAVGFVLLIACVNLANMLLGRAASRQREIAIRSAIGAGRHRIVRMLLVESTMLAMAGGLASILVAWWGTRALAVAQPGNYLGASGQDGLGVVGFELIHLDATTFAFTFGVSLFVGVMFGIVPALQTAKLSLTSALKDAGSATLAGLSRVTSRRMLVIAEVAMAIVLLSGSGLMIRSLANRLKVNPGFDATNVLSLRLTLSPDQAVRDSLPGFYNLLQARLGALPGVKSVGLSDCPPLNGGCNTTVLTFPDREKTPGTSAPTIGVHVISPDWFNTLRISLVRGRLLNDNDRLATPKVLLISETAAKKYWPNENPIGKRAAVWQGGFHTGAEIVGIVRDVRYGSIDSLPLPDSYMSYNQAPRGRMMIYVRTAGDPMALVAPARNAIHDMSASYVVDDIQSMTTRVSAASSQSRFLATLLSMFAVFALALSAIGIYGVMSFGVMQRTRELGIRMALGAERTAIFRIVIGECALLAFGGIAIGVVIALVLSRALQSLLFDVSPNDPSTYVVIVGVLATTALLATWIPARRAAAVDPLVALRDS